MRTTDMSTPKSNKIQSPKTPGGISKTLLTPCRRLGLSRNWKRSGSSPFISPLVNSNGIKQETVDIRKRKKCLGDETLDTSISRKTNSETSDNNDTTTSKTVDLPCKKKSKCLMSSINKSLEEPTEIDPHDSENIIATPVRSKSKKNKNLSLKNNIADIDMQKDSQISVSKENVNQTETTTATNVKKPKELQKECIVIIQKKVFKNLIKSKNSASQVNDAENNMKKDSATSKSLFDSDSDEVPLSHINKKDKLVEEDDDFIDNSEIKLKTDVRSPKSKTKKIKSDLTKVSKPIESKPSQTLFDNDDVFADKKTILIKKTYEKVTKPHKAKSTGSITQKDIDELKARIEAKKKLLLAKSLTPETAELRCLIKKWQKGCQDALMELLELMRNKFPEQNMDYSDMLETLKIPASLVGYDAENDCFISPNDESVILGQFIE